MDISNLHPVDTIVINKINQLVIHITNITATITTTKSSAITSSIGAIQNTIRYTPVCLEPVDHLPGTKGVAFSQVMK
jgi:hypothetical protein